MNENSQIQQDFSSFNFINTKGRKDQFQYFPETRRSIVLSQFDISPSKQTFHKTSTKTQIDHLSQENEENYVSVRDFYDHINNSSHLSKSQLDILLQRTERNRQNGFLILNSTINPKINLCQMQLENSKMEIFNGQSDSNLRRQLRQTSFVLTRPAKSSFGSGLDCKNQDEAANQQVEIKQNYTNKQYQRRSSKLQVEQFQNTLQKMIQEKNCNQLQINHQISENNDLIESSSLTQEQDNLQKSQNQQPVDDDQASKLDNITKFKKKEDKLTNTFVARLGIFQRFLRNMKNLSQIYKFRSMTGEQKLRFNDQSFFLEKKKEIANARIRKKTLIKIFSKVFVKLLNQVPVFHPLHFVVVGLEIILLLTLIPQVFILSLANSFDVTFLKEGIIKLIFYYFPSFMLLICILARLNTGFFKENIAVNDRKKIFLNYYQSGALMIDFITALSFLTNDFYFYMFLPLKIYQIQNSIVKLDTKFSLSQRFSLSFQIFKLIFLVIILAHLNGCIFHQVGKNVSESWMTKNNLQDSDWYERYINSVYFSFITMVTVGYGDITPVSLQEKSFVIFMVVYSCGVFGYIVSSIGNIFTQRALIQEKYKRQLLDMIQYMRTRNINQSIQQQVFQYLHYLEQMDYYNHQKGEEIVRKLSPHLQQQINISSYYPFLKNSNYFKLNFKDSILIKASLKMKELTFGPGQIIFKEDDQDNRIFYILKGEVQLSSNNHKISIKDEDDNCFGINEFFTGECRSLSAKSLTVSQILYLELNDFKEVLQSDPLEYGESIVEIILKNLKKTLPSPFPHAQQIINYKFINQEKFCSLKDQVIFSKISIDQSCYFCNKFSHTYERCPLYTIKNQRLLTIQRSKRSVNQERKKFERFDRDKYNSLIENAEVKLNLRAVRLNFINNQAIDKNEMIQLVQDNMQIENDIDFYRYNDAFQIKQNEEGQDFNIVLVSSDKIAEEFFLEEEDLEQSEEGLESLKPQRNSNKKMTTSSTVYTESHLEDQKILSQNNFMQKRGNQTLQNQYQSSNSLNMQNLNEKFYPLREHISQQNQRIQSQYRQQQTLRQNSDVSNYQNSFEGSSSKLQDQNLLKQIMNFIELTQNRQDTENQTEIKNHFLKDEFFIINNFDSIKEFSRYFPKNNINVVLGQINKINIKKPKQVQKKSKKNIHKPRNTLFKSMQDKKKRVLAKINTYRVFGIFNKKPQIPSQNQSSSENQSNILQSIIQEQQDLNTDQKSENKLLQAHQSDKPISIFQKLKKLN